jgi:dihydroorotate dehydrogenase electron transfer subunit
LKESKNDVFLGFRSKEFIVMEKEFKNVSDNLYVGTDDGSYGYNGLIVNYFKKIIEENNYDIIYSCGPNPMLKEVSNIAKNSNIKCQVSLEQRMGCGIGACLVCACKIKVTHNNKGWTYKHVCKDGPVFWSDEVIFDD